MLLDKLKNNKSIAIYIAILFFMSLLITVINLGFKKEFIGEDSGLIYYFPDRLFNYVYYVWDSMWAPGKISITTLFGFVWTNILLCLQSIGLSYFFIQRLLFFAFLFVSATGMFYLFKTLIPLHREIENKESLYFGAFCSSLLYLLNHYVMYMVGFPIIPFHITYMVLPWLLFFFIKNLYIKSSFTDTLIFSLLTLLFLGGNPASTLLSVILFIGYFIYFFRDFLKSTSQKYQFIVTFVGLITLLSLFITLPVIKMGSSPYGGDTSLLGDYVQSFKYNSTYTSLLNLFILGGTVVWSNSSFYPLYTTNPIYIFLGYTILIIALLALLSKKDIKLKVFFLTVMIVSIFFAKGMQEPFAEINAFLYDKFAFLRIYRAVYNKFMFLSVFSYSILIGLSGLYIYNKISLHVRKRNYAVYLLPIIIVTYGLPFFIGGIIPNAFLTKLPNDYKNLSLLINDKSDYKILSVPPTPNGGGPLLNWKNGNKYVGPQMESFVLDKPVLDSYFFIKEGLNGLKPDDSWKTKKFIKNFPNILKYTNIYNVKYIFLHKDFLTEYNFNKSEVVRKIGSKNDSLEYAKILENRYDYTKVVNSPVYDLYKVSDSNFLDHFYFPQQIIYARNQKKTLYSKKSKNIKRSYAIISKNKHINITRQDTNIKVTVDKINQTKYILKITNAKNSHLIVFSESFNKNWKLYLSNRKSKINSNNKLIVIWSYLTDTLNTQSVDESRHLIANGYANAWIIDPNKFCANTETCVKNKNGSYNFTALVEFAPQKYFHVGLLFSLITLVISFSYILYLKFIRKISK